MSVTCGHNVGLCWMWLEGWSVLHTVRCGDMSETSRESWLALDVFFTDVSVRRGEQGRLL